jgi:hypothetical protein
MSYNFINFVEGPEIKKVDGLRRNFDRFLFFCWDGWEGIWVLIMDWPGRSPAL